MIYTHYLTYMKACMHTLHDITQPYITDADAYIRIHRIALHHNILHYVTKLPGNTMHYTTCMHACMHALNKYTHTCTRACDPHTCMTQIACRHRTTPYYITPYQHALHACTHTRALHTCVHTFAWACIHTRHALHDKTSHYMTYTDCIQTLHQMHTRMQTLHTYVHCTHACMHYITCIHALHHITLH